MSNRFQPVVLIDDEHGDDKGVGISNERFGRRGRRERQERSEQRRKNNGKKTRKRSRWKKEIQELMRLGEYEVAQDPYRGIGFLNNRNNTENKHDEDINLVDANSNKMRITHSSSGGEKSDKIVTPWDICQWGILSMPKNTGIPQEEQGKTSNGEMNIDDNKTDGSFLFDPNDAQSMVRSLTKSCCPSILAWTKERLEEKNRKNQQLKKKRKQHNTAGKKRNRSSCEQDVNNESVCAEFPYLGMRPSNVKYYCPCDLNPFCLGSMGGIMNELLQERCERDITISTIHENENAGEKTDSNSRKRAKSFEFGSIYNNDNNERKINHDAEIEIVDVDQNTKTVATGSEHNESSSIFAFMGGIAKSSGYFDRNKKIENVECKKNAETPTTTIATCKGLGPGRSKPETGEPAEVYNCKNDIKKHNFSIEGYSQATKDQMIKLRGFKNVDISKIKIFIQNIFEISEHSNSDSITMTMEEYIHTMIEWHKSLIFTNPTTKDCDLSNKNIAIALPPGIQNLGATCYLNTQLQCLAQNPVFLDGIFSWRPVNSTHKMNGVMTKLQKLMAQMLIGSDGKYTSLDFSNALGIQHNEQQDPNEFARLLFDRMEESFQLCSINSSGVETSHDNINCGNGLGKLLQRIFHGTTTYEIVCMKCGNTSVRSEGFMDLNLPIVHRQDFEEDETDYFDENESNNGLRKDMPGFVKRKRRKKGIIEKAFQRQKKNAKADTDVQFCFDQYTKAEILEGENQYFCDTCNSKQDAKRITSLTKLPPVLNIQLSRYVFDREKFVKKKLMDKVRLPAILTIDKHDSVDSRNDNSCSASAAKTKQYLKKKYLLCAVMRHQGTSAYSGHYVAEAMDWTIGQWYEFNDETVKVLPAPSNSYVPHVFLDAEDDKIENRTKSAGSQDAYNMYYVDEEYLGKNAISTMLRNQRLNSIQNGSIKIKLSEKNGVLSNLIREKVKRYSDLKELCYIDQAISDRLSRRKDGIRKYMFLDPSSVLLQEGQRKEDDEPHFWVDGESLRYFLACDRSLDDKLRSNEPIICPKSLLCSHGRLHPRNARRGKLLRKPIYNSYVSLLSGERKSMSVTSGVKESDVVGCVITSEERIACEDCSKPFRIELSKKLEFLRNIYDLYEDIIDETRDSTNNARNYPVKEKTEEEEYSFIAARSTITKFKKLVVDLMKSAADFEKGVYLDSSSTHFDFDNNAVLGGIDSLDLSSFRLGANTTECVGINDLLDEKFNSKITCSHGKCNDFNLRVVRYLPYKTWAKVKQLFPNAIDHKILLSMVDGKVRKPNTEDDGCLYCRKEKDAVKNLTSDIEGWAKKTKENCSLKRLLDGKQISVGEIAFHNFDSAQNNCRLVHRDDIANLCKSVRLLGRISKLKRSENVEIKSYVENLAFPSYHSVVLDFEKQPKARLLQSIRSLICCEHKGVIKSAIIDIFGKDEESQQRHQLSNGIAVLSDEEYNAYINSLAELLIILNCDYHKEEDSGKALQEKAPLMFDDVKKFVASCHPTITMKVEKNTLSDEVILFSLDGNSKEFSIVPGICDHETCKKDFVPMVQKDVEAIVESVSVDSVETGGINKDADRKTDYRIGSMAMSPIVVESDLEDYADTTENKQNVRIFQYKTDSELFVALQSLRTAVGLPSSDSIEDLNFGLRRSTRKRKTKFPVGSIIRECNINIGLHLNVAALRLLLYQNCQIPLSCKLNIVMLMDDASPLNSVEIAFDWSEKTLNDLVDQLKIKEDGFGESLESDRYKHFFLLYQVDKDDKSGDIDSTLMDSLLQISNIESPDSKSKSSKGKNHASERGFQGTLLQSSTTSCLPTMEKNKDDDDSCCQIEATSKNVERRERSNTIISDDDIDEVLPQTATVGEDVISDSSDGEVAIIPSPSPLITPCNEIGDVQKMNLVSKLIELTASKDESHCFEAVSWAIKLNPNYSEAELIDAAFAKYLDISNS